MAALLNSYSQFLASAGAVGLFSLTLIPQTLRLKTYKKILGNYKDGEIQPVTNDVQNLLEKVLTRMRLAPEDEANLEVFTCYGNDPVHKGSLYLRTGAIVGVPPTFYYKTEADIEKDGLRAGGKIINWDTDAGKRLSKALLLSDKAKAFAIAREINYASSYHVYVDGGLRAFFLSIAYSAGFYANRRLKLRENLRLWARCGIYGVLGGAAYIMYAFTSDVYFCYRDNAVDKNTAQLGWAYAEGGVEFYRKSLARNIALRELMGPEMGPKSYTVYGNDVSTVRRAYVQLTERKSKLEKFFKDFQDKEAAEMETTTSGDTTSETS